MLSKTQINKKLQEKRSEQIKLEYDSLNDLKIKYENEILTMKDKIYNWEIEEQALKQSSLDNKNQLINIKDSDIAGKIDTLNKAIQNSNGVIKNNKNLLKKSYDEKEKINESISQDMNIYEQNYHNLLDSFSKKESQIGLLLKKKIKLETTYNLHNCTYNGFNDMEKKMKNELTQKNIDNMLQRYEMIEENIYNLKMKKKIDKNKKEMIVRIEKEKDILKNIPDNRNAELQEIYEEYNNIIKDDNVDILNEMEKLEQKVKNFDLETKKKIFFQQNLVKNLTLKMNNLENFYKFKTQSQKKQLDQKYSLKNKDIKKLHDEKNLLRKKIDGLKIDIEFLNKSYNSELETLKEKRQKEEEKYNNYLKKNKTDIENNNLQFTDLELKIDKENNELLLEIDNKKNETIKLKNDYSYYIKNNQNVDKTIKDNLKRISKEKEEYNIILKQKKMEYQKSVQEKNNRILYLEKQNLKLTLIENQ